MWKCSIIANTDNPRVGDVTSIESGGSEFGDFTYARRVNRTGPNIDQYVADAKAAFTAWVDQQQSKRNEELVFENKLNAP
jgi:hypothetical protein